MKNLEYIIFEKIIFTYQDHTGFEEIEEFNDTWWNSAWFKMSHKKRATIKEVHFINPKINLGNP